MKNKFFNFTDKIGKGIVKIGNRMLGFGKAELLICTKTENGDVYSYRYDRVSKEEAIAILKNCPGQKLIAYNGELI